LLMGDPTAKSMFLVGSACNRRGGRDRAGGGACFRDHNREDSDEAARSREIHRRHVRSRRPCSGLAWRTRAPGAACGGFGQRAQVVRPGERSVAGREHRLVDSALNTPETQQMSRAPADHVPHAGGFGIRRLALQRPPTYNGEGPRRAMASFIASVGGQGLVTLDYGSGSPQEAAPSSPI